MLNMPFEQTQKIEQEAKKPEKDLDVGLERGVEKLEHFLELMAENLRKEGVPVDNECRVDMNAFREVYSKEVLNNDNQELERLEAGWRDEKSLSKEEYIKERKGGIGERMEMLKTAIFHKNLSPDFIVARTSHFDDVKRGMDNIILEKETGNVVCAFDEVADVSSSRYREKRNKVLKRNLAKEGPTLKYGLKIEEENGKMTLGLGDIKDVPIFYLAISPWLIEEGIRNFRPQAKEQFDYEKRLFDEFILSLNEQIAFLKSSKVKRLPVRTQNGILLFEESLKRFTPEKEKK